MKYYVCVAANNVVGISDSYDVVKEFSSTFYLWNNRRGKIRSLNVYDDDLFLFMNKEYIINSRVSDTFYVTNEEYELVNNMVQYQNEINILSVSLMSVYLLGAINKIQLNDFTITLVNMIYGLSIQIIERLVSYRKDLLEY